MNYNKKNKRISVIMGIYNCADTLADSIDSLINQTYKNWELIMCDDASTDNTYVIAKEYAKKYDNIKLIKNHKNIGLAASLNHCLEYTSGEFIARQDGDDISLTCRFQKQIDFLDNNKNFSFVSSTMYFFDSINIYGKSKLKEMPTKMDFIKGSPFSHAPVMMRKVDLSIIGNYTVNKYLRRGQDYYLWYKFYKNGFLGYNIQESLYIMRYEVSNRKKVKLLDYIYGMKIHFEVLKGLKLPFFYYLYTLKAIVSMMIPNIISDYIHRNRINKTTNGKTININNNTCL